jgi:hypothetical protein
MFERESYGVYTFGTTKIAMCLQKGKLFCRVGGGFISVDEYVDMYTTQELDRIQRASPRQSFKK